MSTSTPLPIRDANLLREVGKQIATLDATRINVMSEREEAVYNVRRAPSTVRRGLAAVMARRYESSEAAKAQLQKPVRFYEYAAPVWERVFGDSDNRGEIAVALSPRDGHTMGALHVLVAAGRRIGEYDATREYAKSCMWRATHGLSTANLGRGVLRAAWKAAVATHGPCRMVGGVPTWARPAPKSNPDTIRRAWWLESCDADGKRYDPSASVRIVSGYIVRNALFATREEATAWLAAHK